MTERILELHVNELDAELGNRNASAHGQFFVERAGTLDDRNDSTATKFDLTRVLAFPKLPGDVR